MVSAVQSLTSCPVVLTAPSKSLAALNRVISAPLADAVIVVVPVPLISSDPVCVMSPVVAVAVSSPPTVETAKSRAVALTNVASPEP